MISHILYRRIYDCGFKNVLLCLEILREVNEVSSVAWRCSAGPFKAFDAISIRGISVCSETFYYVNCLSISPRSKKGRPLINGPTGR